MEFWQSIESNISDATGRCFRILNRRPIAGGCINETICIEGSDTAYFIKINHASFFESFQNEGRALDEILATQTIRVPKPICQGIAKDRSYLILEYIRPGQPTVTSWKQFGQQIAALHKIENEHYGWPRDNTIGATHQPNEPNENWVSFFRQNRLKHQFALCRQKGFQPEGAERLLNSLGQFFIDHEPTPSLLHGDLWSGNVGFATDGTPFIFDPATYYGDRETDIAFTEFFGGFHSEFYNAYNEILPLDSGYQRRKDLYNLYHTLNHFILFSGGYGHQAQEMINQLNKIL